MFAVAVVPVIDVVRVSDRLLSGPPGSFNISTKDGVVAQVSVQARWAIDRARLPAKWAALPADPERELVGPVLNRRRRVHERSDKGVNYSVLPKQSDTIHRPVIRTPVGVGFSPVGRPSELVVVCTASCRFELYGTF